MDLNDVVVYERHQRTPTTDAILAFAKAAEVYSTIIYPGTTEADFFGDDDFDIEALQTLGHVDDIERKLLALHAEGSHSNCIAASVLAIKIACLYIHRAQYEDHIGHRDLAWTFAADARLWCSTAAHMSDKSHFTEFALSAIDKATDGVTAELWELDRRRARPTEIAANAGKAKAAKLKRVEEETIRLYEEGNWGSKSLPDIAVEIRPMIVAFAKKEAYPLATGTDKPLEWLRAHVKRNRPQK